MASTESTHRIAVFPKELRESSGNYPFSGNYPLIEFSAIIRNSSQSKQIESVFLPMPEGLIFAATGTYSSVDLGILGIGGIVPLASAVGEADTGKAMQALSDIGNNIKAQAKSLNVAAAATIAAYTVPTLEPYKDKINFALKQIVSPNTNTTFTGNSPRTFNFTFKLVGRFKSDSYEIRRIHNFFNKYTYAAGGGQSNLILSYPPLWRIKFYADGEENEFIPKIFESYLTNFTAAFNSDSNIYRPDGAPISVDITLTFQESRMLTRDDMLDLAASALSAEESKSNREKVEKSISDAKETKRIADEEASRIAGEQARVEAAAKDKKSKINSDKKAKLLEEQKILTGKTGTNVPYTPAPGAYIPSNATGFGFRTR